MVVRPRTYGIYINTHARARAVSSESDALKTARARETPNHQFSDFRGFGAVWDMDLSTSGPLIMPESTRNPGDPLQKGVQK